MIYIAHRGNINGSNKELENYPDYILKAILMGYNAEIDLWISVNNNIQKLYLGHDGPDYEINTTFLNDNADKLWIHCKNMDAFEYCMNNKLHCFVHNTDMSTLTSKGHPWIFPGVQLINNSVCVMPERVDDVNYWLDGVRNNKCIGLCSDNIEMYKQQYLVIQEHREHREHQEHREHREHREHQEHQEKIKTTKLSNKNKNKNILVFITHATLGYDHANMCIKHLSQSVDPIIFDDVYIYNTHEDELSNKDILELMTVYNIKNCCTNEIQIFPYDKLTPKTLANDCAAIFQYMSKVYSDTDRLLLLKSDIMVSSMLLNELKTMNDNDKFILTPPFILAKARVSNEKILEYTSRQYCKLSDEITFFNEDENNSNQNDRLNGKDGMDHCFEFISCTVKGDFSCHYFTLNIIPYIQMAYQSWGGVYMAQCRPWWKGTINSFTVHKYHSIVSNNREQSRDEAIERYMVEGY